MKDSIFDLEQKIMSCWNIVDDVQVVYEHVLDSPEFSGLSGEHADKIGNLLLGLNAIYEVKFDNMFKAFEVVCQDMRDYRISLEQLQEDVDYLSNVSCIDLDRMAAREYYGD